MPWPMGPWWLRYGPELGQLAAELLRQYRPMIERTVAVPQQL